MKRYWINIIVLIIALSPMALCGQSKDIDAPVWCNRNAGPKIALTFDDGPKPEYAGPILDILAEYGAKGTFFVVGKEAQLFPELIARINQAGHELANHTYSHIRLDMLSPREIATEIVANSDVIQAITGKTPVYFRPPGGRYNRAVLEKVKALGMVTVLWDVNAGDYMRSDMATNGISESDTLDAHTASEIYDRVTSRARDGSIILFHNGGSQTSQALPKVLETLQARGYIFVTLSELLAK